MKTIDVVPTIGACGLEFGCERELVRKTLGSKYRELKKSIVARNTIDAYEYCHVYYTADDKFEAIELFGNIRVYVGDEVVFPSDIDHIKLLFKGIIKKGDSMVDKENSVAITLSQDDKSKIDAILIGRKGYFE